MVIFSTTEYILIFLALLSHYSFGAKLIGYSPITATLVGLSFSGLIVGILANFSAILILPYIIAVIIIGLLWFSYDIIKLLQQKYNISNYLGCYLSLLFIAIILFYFNNPQLFLTADVSGDINISFNMHNLYYANISLEMLNADYFSRLRIAEFYPTEWAQYHFFNSAVLAVLQGLIPNKGLFSYFMAQTTLLILVLLSFAEQLFLSKRVTIYHYFAYGLWLIIGFTLFIGALKWNFLTSGMFSIFAMVHFLIALYKGNQKQSIVFLLLLGASAFRLLPLTLILLTYLSYVWYIKTPQNLITQIKQKTMFFVKNNIFITITLLIFILYVSATFFLGAPGRTRFLALDWAPTSGWLHPLFVYHLQAYVGQFLSLLDLFPSYQRFPIFGKINTAGLHSYFILTTTAVLIAAIIYTYRTIIAYSYSLVGILRNNLWTLGIFLLTLSAILAVVFIKLKMLPVVEISTLIVLVIIPYALINGLIAFNLRNVNGTISEQNYKFVLFTQFIILLYLLTGINALKGPATYIFYDVFLWGLIGIALYYLPSNRLSKIIILSLAIYFIIFFNIRLNAVLYTPEYQDANYFNTINISELLADDFEQNNYVDSNQFFIKEYQDPAKNGVYASILGARIKYDEENRPYYVSRPFIDKRNLSE